MSYGVGAEKIVFDIETAGLEDATEFIEAGKPPSNYKSADAIARWEAADKEDIAATAALDPDLCRVVAIGFQSDQEVDPTVLVAENTFQEIEALRKFWERVTRGRSNAELIGFNILGFDLPVLFRRSLYLGVPYPSIQIDRFRHPNVVDLAQILNFNGAFLKKGRTKNFYCRRFGIPLTDTASGSDIPAMVAEGNYEGVRSHCELDVRAEVALAERLGVINTPVIF